MCFALVFETDAKSLYTYALDFFACSGSKSSGLFFMIMTLVELRGDWPRLGVSNERCVQDSKVGPLRVSCGRLVVFVALGMYRGLCCFSLGVGFHEGNEYIICFLRREA